jgi:hypothetical protein
VSVALAAALALVAAFPPPAPEEEAEPARTVGDFLEGFPGPQEGFLIRLQSLCGGGIYRGRVVSDDPEDEAMRREVLRVGPAECTLNGDDRLVSIDIPFAVGADATRVWTVQRTAGGLRLTHHHEGDAVTGYGGETVGEGTFTRQTFPADAASRALFEREGLPASTGNVWAFEVSPGDSLAYELKREGRRFRAEFDLMRRVAGDAPAP